MRTILPQPLVRVLMDSTHLKMYLRWLSKEESCFFGGAVLDSTVLGRLRRDHDFKNGECVLYCTLKPAAVV